MCALSKDLSFKNLILGGEICFYSKISKYQLRVIATEILNSKQVTFANFQLYVFQWGDKTHTHRYKLSIFLVVSVDLS